LYNPFSVPVPVGVPEIVPVEVLKVNPDGRVELQPEHVLPREYDVGVGPVFTGETAVTATFVTKPNAYPELLDCDPLYEIVPELLAETAFSSNKLVRSSSLDFFSLQEASETSKAGIIKNFFTIMNYLSKKKDVNDFQFLPALNFNHKLTGTLF